jgi:N-acetylmuramoyl-L-alanine amidase
MNNNRLQPWLSRLSMVLAAGKGKNLRRIVNPLATFLIFSMVVAGAVAQQPNKVSEERVTKTDVNELQEPPIARDYKPQTSADVTQERLIAAVQRALQTKPRSNPDLIAPSLAGVQLLSLQVDKKRQEIVLNFSQQILNYGTGSDLEVVLQHVMSSVGEVEIAWSTINYKVHVDGTPLKDILAPMDEKIIRDAKASGERDAKGPGEKLQSMANLGTGSLSGKRIVISPGHGWYWNESFRAWKLQRDYHQGIVEDVVNAEMVMLLNDELKPTGADIIPARNLSKSAGNGETGKSKWEEAAKYHIRAQGAPSSVWNVGDTDYNKDITSRPLYANNMGADIMVSIHNNGGKGTGTETWYASDNGQQKESLRLATAVHNKVITAIRQQYDPNWKDRLVKSCGTCYGENKYATRPAILLEIAFMDTPAPDNAALRDEKFKKIVATAIREGIEEYYGVTTPKGSFSLSPVIPFTTTIPQGSTASFSVGVKSDGGFTGKVQMAAKNLPGGRVITGTAWQPASVSPSANGTAYATFTLATDTKTPVGTFNVDLEGNSGGVTKKTTVQVTIKR